MSPSLEEALFIIDQVIEELEPTLDLGGLNLDFFPERVWDADHISHLSMRRNLLKKLPVELTYLTRLTQLSLADNQIDAIPPEINRLHTLTHLNLKNNSLTELPVELLDLTNLKMLRLEGNPLPLPKDIIRKWDRPQEILAYYKKYHIVEPEPPPPTIDNKIFNLFDDEAFAGFLEEMTIPGLEVAFESEEDKRSLIDTLIAYYDEVGLQDGLIGLLEIYRPGHFEIYLNDKKKE
ncbi:MAG: hypothetical protein AAF633_12545 [Chloroflexota bacterium]